jgi:biotin synthase
VLEMGLFDRIPQLTADICESGQGVSPEVALELANLPEAATPWLMAAAHQVRYHFKGDEVRFCSIVSARSGHCGEDCAFCAQSRDSAADIETYSLRPADWLAAQAEEARRKGAGEFSIVTAGKRVSPQDLERIGGVVEEVAELGMEPCASLGVLDEEQLAGLKARGLEVFHHNLETARSHYQEIVSTRSYDDNVKTVEAVKAAGLKVCCGGLFGMGESWAQRIELFAELVRLEVDRVPINFLIPIEGTRLAEQPLLPAMEALRIIALARLMLPTREINVAGGRERVLGQLQANVFLAGANAILVGNYLTTNGRLVEDDVELARICGLTPRGAPE